MNDSLLFGIRYNLQKCTDRKAHIKKPYKL